MASRTLNKASAAKVRRALSALGPILLILGALLNAPATGWSLEPQSEDLTLLVTAGLGGRLVNTEGQTMAVVATALQAEAEAARAEGRQVVIFDAGRTVTPYAESRHEGGQSTLAVLQAGGTQAFAPDAMDFSLGRKAFEKLAQQSGIPILLPYLAKPHTQPDKLPHEILLSLERGPSIRLISLFDPVFRGDLQASSHPPRDEHLPELLGSPEVIDLIIVHSGGSGKETRSRELTWNILDDPRGADLLLDPDMSHDMLVEAQVDGQAVFLVGREREKSNWQILRIDVRAERHGNSWRLADLQPTALSIASDQVADSELAERVRKSWERFHHDNDVPLIGGGPTDYEELRRFALAAMRESTRAEVAVLNRGALRPVADKFFQGERLTNEAVLRMLSIDQRIEVIELTGRQLLKLASDAADRVYLDGSPRSDALEFLGYQDGKVNGRPVVSDEIYTIVTNRYLLAGGDSHSILAELEENPNRELLPELRRDVVIPRLARADEPFSDLSRRSLWRYGVRELALYADGVQTDRATEYADSSDSRASASDSVTVRSRVRLRLDLDRTRWRWENRLKAGFGSIDLDDETREIEDDLVLDSSMVFVKTRVFGGSPFASLTLDSELRRNRNADGDKTPRQLEETLSAGLTWERDHLRRVRIGGVVREYPNLERNRQFGVQGEADLAWPSVRSSDQRGFEVTLLAEHLEDDLSRVDRFDFQARFFFPMVHNLSFTPAANYYWLDDSNFPGDASYYRLSLGLSYRWAGKHQSW